MTIRNRIIRLQPTDPHLLRAFEKYLLKSIDKNDRLLMLYRFDNTVSIGLHQNAWLSTKLQKLQKDGVNLVQRKTGAGSFYHDLGTAEFCFIAPSNPLLFRTKCQIIVNALKQLDVDISWKQIAFLLGGDKRVGAVTGIAAKGMTYIHGSILIRSDLHNFDYYTRPVANFERKKNIETRSRLRVTNLSDAYPELCEHAVLDAIAESYCRYHGDSIETIEYSEADILALPYVEETYQKEREQAWYFLEPPDTAHNIQHTFQWGALDLYFDIEGDTFTNVALYSDAVDHRLIFKLKNAITGSPLDKKLAMLVRDNPELREPISEFRHWLMSYLKSF